MGVDNKRYIRTTSWAFRCNASGSSPCSWRPPAHEFFTAAVMIGEHCVRLSTWSRSATSSASCSPSIVCAALMQLLEHVGRSTTAARGGSHRPQLTSTVLAGALVSRWHHPSNRPVLFFCPPLTVARGWTAGSTGSRTTSRRAADGQDLAFFMPDDCLASGMVCAGRSRAW